MKGSIFFKLLGILIITGLLVNFFVYAGVRFFVNATPIKRDMFENFSSENLDKYTAEIGFPPNKDKMARIADENESEIRIEGKGKVWQTSNDLPSLDEVEEHQKKSRMDREKRRLLVESQGRDTGSPNSDTGVPGSSPGSSDFGPGGPPDFHKGPSHKRMPFLYDFFGKGPPPQAIIISRDGTRYGYFLPDRRNFAGKYQRLLFPTLFLVTFLIASAFFAIRFILLPLQTLMKGVEAVAEGDLEHRVQVKGRDEFAALGNSFNRMVERIKETMEAKERLLIDVSHELQSPLARMKLAIELMQEDKAKQRLKLNLKDIEAMVAEILESARLDSSTGSLQIQKSDLSHIIKEFLYVYEAMGSPVFLESTGAPLIAEIDPSRFIIVLRNLIENALKHADAVDKRVDIRVMDQGEHIRIEVKDNGKGIETDEINKLFEPFYRIDKSRNRQTGGYGLGLSLCKRIIDAHSGSIGIDSGVSGTSVWLILPKKNKGNSV
jgi:signal transduction histidine kinase